MTNKDAPNCLYCGAELPSRPSASGNARKWCNENCARKGRKGTGYRLKMAKWAPRLQRPQRPCKGCGNLLPPNARPDRHWCTEACAAKHRPRGPSHRPEYRAQYRREQRGKYFTIIRWTPPAKRRWFAGYCTECGDPYVTQQPHAIYCSTRCAQRVRSRKKQHRRSKRKINGEQIDIKTIAHRDDWTCHLCQQPVTTANWSLDHLTPLSLGGEHTHANVALAHALCNTIRRDMPLPQTQLLLAGTRVTLGLSDLTP